MSASGAQRITRGVHGSSAWDVVWDVAWDVVEDELLNDTGTMAVALQGSLCLGPQIQVTDIARVIAWDVPENNVEALLASVLLASVLLASVLLASVLLASVSLAKAMFVGGLFVQGASALTSALASALASVSALLEERPPLEHFAEVQIDWCLVHVFHE